MDKEVKGIDENMLFNKLERNLLIECLDLEDLETNEELIDKKLLKTKLNYFTK